MDMEEAALEIEKAGDVLGGESSGEETEGSEENEETEGAEGGVTEGEEPGETKEGGDEKGEEPKEEPKVPEGPDASEIAKLEAKIELLKERQPDIKGFYENLDKYLSDEEMALRFEEDQSAYIEAVEQAKAKYLAEHSKAEEIEALERELADKRKQHEVVSAVAEAVREYPDYDHQTIGEFFQNDLTRREQEELQRNAKSYADFFKAVYKKWRERNPGEVETVHAPNIPNARKMAKEGAGERADEMFGDEEKAYLEAVGFAKR